MSDVEELPIGRRVAYWRNRRKMSQQVFADRPGDWLADRLRGKRVGVYGLDYVMTVRAFQPLAQAADVVAFDEEFDLARADVPAGYIPVYFLHGALHLVVGGNGERRTLAIAARLGRLDLRETRRRRGRPGRTARSPRRRARAGG